VEEIFLASRDMYLIPTEKIHNAAFNFLLNALTLYPELIKLQGSKIFTVLKIIETSSSKEFKNIIFTFCLTQEKFISPSRSLFITLNSFLTTNGLCDPINTLDLLEKLQRKREKGSLIWLNEVVLSILFYRQKFTTNNLNEETHIPLQRLIKYCSDCLLYNNYNDLVIEYIALILCYSIDEQEELLAEIFDSIIRSNYKLHYLLFLVELLEGKKEVEEFAALKISKSNKVKRSSIEDSSGQLINEGKVSGESTTKALSTTILGKDLERKYELRHKLVTNTASTLLKTLLNKSLLNDKMFIKDLPEANNTIQESHNKRIKGIFHYITVNL